MLRKFFDPSETEAKAEPKYQFGDAIPFEDIFQNQSDQFLEKKDEPPAEEEKVEEKKEVVAEEKKEEQVVEEQVKETPTIDWKEYVKKPEHRKEVHDLLEIDEQALALSKELAQDEFVKKLITYRKEHGNVTPFIEAATKDYDKLSHMDLLRDDLKKQYPNLSKEKFEVLAKNRIDKRFILGEDADPDEVELAAIDLEVEGEKIRAQRKSEQQAFLDNVKPIDRNEELQRLNQERIDADLKEFEEFKKMVEVSPATTKLFTEKKVVFGEKENSFNYAVDPAIIKDQTLDTNKFYGNFWENGVFNQEKWNKVVAYTLDTKGVENGLINHGRSLGTKQITEVELENVNEKKDQSAPTPTKKSLAKTFKEEGQPITLQELYGG